MASHNYQLDLLVWSNNQSMRQNWEYMAKMKDNELEFKRGQVFLTKDHPDSIHQVLKKKSGK
jgi:hypothetical protein